MLRNALHLRLPDTVNGVKAEGDILIAIDTGTGAFAAGDIVTFDGDSNKYLVAAATATAITRLLGLRQALADNTAITAGGAYTANMAFDRNAFLLASRTRNAAGRRYCG